ncbi:MAG: DUF6531 domain-containing protein [Bacteroidota bacterium]
MLVALLLMPRSGQASPAWSAIGNGAVTITCLTTAPEAGSPIVIAVDFSNVDGFFTSEGVAGTITWPTVDGLTLDSVDAPAGVSVSQTATSVTAQLGDIGPNQTKRVTLTFSATDAGSFTMSANQTQTNFDPDLSNNETAKTIAIEEGGTDVFVRKTAEPANVILGQRVVYRIRVGNLGPNDVSVATMQDPLPRTASGADALGTVTWRFEPQVAGDSCVLSLGVLTCQLNNLAAGTERSVFVDGVVIGADAQDSLTNTATVESAEPDSDSENNQSTAVVTVQTSADLAVEKSARRDSVMVGENVVYDIVVTNNGPNDAQNVRVVDQLPRNLSRGLRRNANAISATGSGFTCTLATEEVTCTAPSLAAGASTTIALTVQITGRGRLRNTVTASSDTADPSLSNNEAQAIITTGRRIASGNPETTIWGDPINTATGELFFTTPLDVRTEGPFPLNLHRYYASQMGTYQPDAVPMPMGPNWSHPYLVTLVVQGDFADVITHTGRQYAFIRSGNDWAPSPEASPHQLIEDGDEFVFGDGEIHLLYRFNAEGRPIAMRRPDAHRFQFDYQNDRLSRVRDAFGRSLTFAYNGDGLLTSVTNGTATATYGYTDGVLTEATAADGATTQYTYTDEPDFPALLVHETRPEGNQPLTQTYDASGRVTSQQNADGHTTTFAYADLVTTVTLPDGVQEVYTHDDLGRLLNLIRADGTTTGLTYGALGRRSQIDRPDGTSYQLSYGTDGLLQRLTRADGSTQTYRYTPYTVDGITFRNVNGITLPDGSDVAFTFDGEGRITSTTDAEAKTWTFTYTAQHLVSGFTAPDGGGVQLSYDAGGRLAQRVDPAGRTLSYAADAQGHLTQMTLPDGSQRQFTYDAMGRMLTRVDEGNRSYAYRYTANGDLSGYTDPLGGTGSFAYDGNDRMTGATNPEGGSSLLAYDARGNVASVQDGAGHAQTFTYTPDSQTDAVTLDGGAYGLAYDPLDRLRTLSLPDGGAYRFAHDEHGNLTQLTYPGGTVFDVSYDPLDRLTNTVEGGVPNHTLGQRSDGLLMASSTGGAPRVTYELDAAGRLTALRDATGATWARTYDALGRLASRTNPQGQTWSFSYDDRDRMTQAQRPDGSTVGFTYDVTDQITQAQYPGTTLDFTYDALGRLTSGPDIDLAYDATDQVTETNGIAITRNAIGQPTQIQWPSGPTITYAYDGNARLQSISENGTEVMTFAFTARGFPEAITRTNGTTTAYTFNPDGRATEIHETHGETTRARLALTYDGLRLTEALREQPLPLRLDAATVDIPYRTGHELQNATYDPLGQLTAQGDMALTWDGADRGSALTLGTRTVTFTHDGFDRLVTRTDDSGTQRFVWSDGFDESAVATEQHDGTDRWYYVHLPDGRLLYRIEAATGARQFYHFDERGNTLFMTDDVGDVVQAYAYSPYGATINRSTDLANPFTFMGQFSVIEEPESSLLHTEKRIYDRSTRRFVSPDPVRDQFHPLSVNPYGYGTQDPMGYIDPSGESSISSAASAVGDAGYAALDGGCDVILAVFGEGSGQGDNVLSGASLGSFVAEQAATRKGANQARFFGRYAKAFAKMGLRDLAVQIARKGAAAKSASKIKADKAGKLGAAAFALSAAVAVCRAKVKSERSLVRYEQQLLRHTESYLKRIERLAISYANKTITFERYQQLLELTQEWYEEGLVAIHDVQFWDQWVTYVEGLGTALDGASPIPVYERFRWLGKAITGY